jgi:hypothetical protein
MTKEELKQEVAAKINPLMQSLGTVVDGPLGMEEYSKRVFDSNDVKLICDRLFEETWNIMIELTKAVDESRQKEIRNLMQATRNL